MKAFVFLLLLANLLFYAFSEGYFGHPENPDAERLNKQVAPERMRVVARGEGPQPPAVVKETAPAAPSQPDAASATPVPAPAENPLPEPVKTEDKESAAKPSVVEKSEKPEKVARAEEAPACLAWEQLTLSEAEQIVALLGARYPSFKASKKVAGGESNGWWVYIPPLPGKAEADKKAGELKQFGVSDYFIVQEGSSRYAISLGVFSTEKGAQDRLAQLKDEGVRSARVMPRPGKDSPISVQATGPAAAKAAVTASVAKVAPRRAALACK